MKWYELNKYEFELYAPKRVKRLVFAAGVALWGMYLFVLLFV